VTFKFLMSLQELKDKTPTDLLALAESLEIENASTLRKQDMMFAILKALADEGVEIFGSGVLELLQDGFGFLRSPGSQLPARSGRYLRLALADPALRPAHRRYVDGLVRSPREGERYFALLKVDAINFEDPENIEAQGPLRQPDPALS
jgi:transcription termination factor Rho